MPTSMLKSVTCIGRQMHTTPGDTRCDTKLSYLKLIKKQNYQEANIIRHFKQKACHLKVLWITFLGLKMSRDLHRGGCNRTKPGLASLFISVIIQENCNHVYLNIYHQQTILTELKYNHSSRRLMREWLELNGIP